MRALITIAISLLALTATEAAPADSAEQARLAPGFGRRSPVYGEFIRTFTFGGSQLPIVQPGASLVFPLATVPPVGVTYVEEPTRVGLLVPRGTYLASWVLNPSESASVTLLVNGVAPTTGSSYPYTQALAAGVVRFEYLVEAPLEENLISLVNSGSTLFALDQIPNTGVGDTSIITQIRVMRVSNPRPALAR